MVIQENALFPPSQENVAFKENSTVLIWRNSQNMSYAPHWHTAMEVIVPLENSYDVSIYSNEYHILSHEILIIPPGEIHSLSAPDTGLRIIYLIDISFLSKIKGFVSIQTLMSQPLHITHISHPKIHKNILNELLDIETEYFSNKQCCEMTIYSILLKIFTELAYSRTQGTELFPGSRDYKKKEYIQKINIVLDFIDSNYTEGITLDDMADMAGFSKYHFSRLFAQYTRHTFCDYLNLRRIKAAETLLLNDDLSITEIALQSGFSSIATFNRVFKAFKSCSPSEYRSLNKHSSI